VLRFLQKRLGVWYCNAATNDPPVDEIFGVKNWQIGVELKLEAVR
jgi:hypothetical protein